MAQNPNMTEISKTKLQEYKILEFLVDKLLDVYEDEILEAIGSVEHFEDLDMEESLEILIDRKEELLKLPKEKRAKLWQSPMRHIPVYVPGSEHEADHLAGRL